jgi:hypothetical protein
MAGEALESERTPISPRWEAISEIAFRGILYLFLGSAINLLPPMVAYFTGAGSGSRMPTSLTGVLAAGDLLIAVTAMLPLELANLGLNTDKAKRSRVIIIVVGASVQCMALIFYVMTSANAASHAGNSPPVFKNLSMVSVAEASEVLFTLAVIVGLACEGFLAANTPSGQLAPAPSGDTPAQGEMPVPRQRVAQSAQDEPGDQEKRTAA